MEKSIFCLISAMELGNTHGVIGRTDIQHHKDLEKYHYYLLLNWAGWVKLITKTELIL